MLQNKFVHDRSLEKKHELSYIVLRFTCLFNYFFLVMKTPTFRAGHPSTPYPHHMFLNHWCPIGLLHRTLPLYLT